jgi:hypothetical protein
MFFENKIVAYILITYTFILIEFSELFAAASFFSCFFRTRKKDRANSGTNRLEKRNIVLQKNDTF